MATRTAFAVPSGKRWGSPALIDGLLAYAVAMAVGVAVFTSSAGSLPWPAYVFALGFGLILLIRRRYPVVVLILTSLGICVYYTLQYPPIGLALPIAGALFSAAEAGRLRISVIISVILVGLAVLPDRWRARHWAAARLRTATGHRVDGSIAGARRWRPVAPAAQGVPA
jgi:hypothetical protein